MGRVKLIRIIGLKIFQALVKWKLHFTANTALSSVFNQDGKRIFVAYNAKNEPITVIFFNSDQQPVHEMVVEPHSMNLEEIEHSN